MEDLSLHILDVVENGIRAGADEIHVILKNGGGDSLTLLIRDNGCGMDEATASRAADPFYSTKEGKSFGFGISLLAQAAEETGGWLEVSSRPGEGTEVKALFHRDHIDMKPLGDLELTMNLLRLSHGDIRFHLETFDDKTD